MTSRNESTATPRPVPPATPNSQRVTLSVAQARWCIVLAALLWSTSGLFTKAPWVEFWPVEQRGLQLGFWRALFAGLVLLPFVRRVTIPPLLIVGALCFAVMNAAFLTAMTMTTAANAIWLQSAAPAWVFLIGVGLMGEPYSRDDVMMFVLALAGVGLIVFCEWYDAAGMDLHMQGCLWGLVAGLAFAGVVLSVRGLRGHDTAWIIAFCLLVSAGVTAPFVFRLGHWPDARTLGILALFGSLQMALPYVFFAWGTRTITGHEASFLTLFEPLLVPVWVFIVWRHEPNYQPPASWTLVGGGLILAGLIIRYGGFLPRPKIPARSASE